MSFSLKNSQDGDRQRDGDDVDVGDEVPGEKERGIRQRETTTESERVRKIFSFILASIFYFSFHIYKIEIDRERERERWEEYMEEYISGGR